LLYCTLWGGLSSPGLAGGAWARAVLRDE
jgi:hypothetical protein